VKATLGIGGAFSATYAIPAGLKHQARIAIRLDSTPAGFHSYHWFWNKVKANP